MDDCVYSIKANEIHFNTGNVARFAFPVVDAIQFGEVLAVLIRPPNGTIYNENVFGVDLFGNILWQIEPQYPDNVDAAYCGLHSEEGYAVVGNIKDLSLYLDPPTGKIVNRRLQTHW